MINEIFEKVDFDTSGGLNFGEYEFLLQLLQNSNGFTELEKDELRKIFRRYDTGSDNAMAAEGLSSALSWLGFKIPMAEVKVVLHAVDKDGGQMMDWEEFVLAVAMVRDGEVKKAKDILEEFDQDKNGALSIDELERAMKVYSETSRALIVEVVKEVTDNPRYFNARRSADFRADLRIEDIPDFLTVWRKREGLLQHELNDLETAFRHYDFDVTGMIKINHMQKVLRWFGYRIPDEACMRLGKVADITKSGHINFRDLRWIMRIELEECLKAYEAAFRRMDFENKGHVSNQQADQLFKELGFESRDQGMDRFTEGLSSILKKDVDLKYFVKQCLKKKNARINHMRTTCGFTSQQIAVLEKLFHEHATEEPQQGYVVTKQHFKIAAAGLFRTPISASLRGALGELLKDHNSDPIFFLNFKDFIHKIEPFKHIQALDTAEKEQAALREANYSAKEVAEFRELFKGYLPLNAADELLGQDAIRRLVGSICPAWKEQSFAVAIA